MTTEQLHRLGHGWPRFARHDSWTSLALHDGETGLLRNVGETAVLRMTAKRLCCAMTAKQICVAVTPKHPSLRGAKRRGSPWINSFLTMTKVKKVDDAL
ncbi:hypothetical protein [Limnohabitans sp. Bal53]|uniref:hypothetical protein n=1 Tax=Limnohabitans sp. Bal53 TaxID=1977910 RepID=UPI000DD223B9|nr:hypothetical protein [Limnohabitans sp. Bal53]PUE42884.1 hypothetical protein B9Z50_03450 [Limnohabitans sp. Bal53]